MKNFKENDMNNFKENDRKHHAPARSYQGRGHNVQHDKKNRRFSNEKENAKKRGRGGIDHKPTYGYDRASYGKAGKKSTGNLPKAASAIAGGEIVTDDTTRLEGRNPVAEALKAGRTINRVYTLKRQGNARGTDDYLAVLLAKCRETGASISYVTREVLDHMSITGAHQGIIALAASHAYADLEEVLQRAETAGETPFLLMLDGIQDNHNLGAILRIADIAGVTAVIIPRHRSAALDATVAKTSAGAIEYVPCCRVANLTKTLEMLKEKGFWIYGADVNGNSQSIYDTEFSAKICLVIGSEGSGISEKLLQHCDFSVHIPQKGHIDSLNAAVACGIITFEIMRKRKL